MNENYENYDVNEVEIDFTDFFFYLLRKWKSLVAMILVGTILGSAFYVMKTTKVENVDEEDYQPDADVEANMKLATQYRKLYDQQMDYNEHSIAMQINPNHVYEGTLTYYLVAGEQTEMLSQLYMNLINEQTLLKNVKEAAELNCDEQYVRELLSSRGSKKDNDDNDSLSQNVVNNIQVVTPEIEPSSMVLTYQVDYMNQENCEKMLIAIQNAVDTMKQKYEETYGMHDLQLAQTALAVVVDQTYMDKQNTNATLMDSYLSQLNRLEGSFGDTEKAYYQKVYLADEYVNSKQSQVAQTGIDVKSLVKWLIVGTIGFIILWGAYYFFKYLLDPSIKTLDDIKQRALPVIGCIDYKKKCKDFIERIEQKRYCQYDSICYIVTAIQELSSGDIILCIDPDSEIEKQLGKELEQKATNLKSGGLLHIDVETLKQAKKVSGIVLVVQLKKTSRKEFQQEIEICKMQKITILGVIGIAE